MESSSTEEIMAKLAEIELEIGAEMEALRDLLEL